MFNVFSSLMLFALASTVTLTGAKPFDGLERRVDFDTVAFAQESILNAMHDQIQATILPKLWKLSFNSGNPATQLAKVEALFDNATIGIRNATAERIPSGSTASQISAEYRLGTSVISPFMDILLPLGQFDRTDKFMALLQPLDNSVVKLLDSIQDTWEDSLIYATANSGVATGVEIGLLGDLDLGGALVTLGLTA